MDLSGATTNISMFYIINSLHVIELMAVRVLIVIMVYCSPRFTWFLRQVCMISVLEVGLDKTSEKCF